MRYVLFGDGIWAANSLRLLVENGSEIIAVVGRVQSSNDSLQLMATELKLPYHVFERVNESSAVEAVRACNADLHISVSYDQILRSPIRQTAQQGFINCHAGMLPYYRGRNVINWAIINNESQLGITVHFVDDGIDTGDILLQDAVPIHWEDTYAEVLASVQTAIPPLIVRSVRLIEQGRASRTPQNHLLGTYFARRIPGDEYIDWRDTSLNIYNKIRAITHPGPGARSALQGRPLVIWQAEYDLDWPKYLATPGEVVGHTVDRCVRVKTGDSTIVLRSLQLEDEDEVGVPGFRIGTRLG